MKGDASRVKFYDFIKNCGFVEIEITGAGLANLSNELVNQGILLKKVVRKSDTIMLIRISKKFAPSTFAILQKKCYNYHITRKFGVLDAKIGVLCGFFVLCVALLILSLFCYGVEISSDDEALCSRVREVLNAHNFDGGQLWYNLDFDAIEQVLREEIDGIGLVNVSRRGGFLWINFSSVTLKDTLTPANTMGILATQNGVISRIFVNSGTALVCAGDTVRIGQMLIAPYYLDDEETQVPCEAAGNVYLFVWESATVEFCENSVEYARTGRTETFSKITFGDDCLADSNTETSFEYYEVEDRTEYLSNVLPIKIVYTTYFETEAVRVNKKFADEQDALVYEARENALKLAGNKEILDERHTISLIGDTYYITYYLKTEVHI